jgi:hypothetical protein
VAERERGLTAINDSRAARRRAIVFGRVRLREAAPQFWLWTVVGLAVFAVVYWRYAESELKNQKSAVLARQRAVEASIGKQGFEMVERLEGWARELAGVPFTQAIAPDTKLDAVVAGPGIYLRLPIADARATGSLRKVAQKSLRDGFTACLFVGRRGDPAEGPPCHSAAQCEPGSLCNEWNVCAAPGQPFNLRLLYSALRVLTPEWRQELEQAKNDLAVRALEGDLDKVTKYDVPIGAEVVRRAEYFTLVLDEEPEGGLPPEDKALDESREQQLQSLPHFARVGIWDIRNGRRLVALRGEAAGRFVQTGGRRVDDPKIQRAQQRQANNCALAVEVKDRILESTGTAPVPEANAVEEPVLGSPP